MLITLNKKYIKSYNDILEHTKSKTRVIICYTGHVNRSCIPSMDKFPVFFTNDMFVEQSELYKKLSAWALNIIIFNCCNLDQYYNLMQLLTQI